MTTSEKVPFLDLVTPHVELENELAEVFKSALRTAGFIGGPMVENFERDFATFCDAKYCVGVNSGTDALRFALTAVGVGPGESVITVPHTFIATTEAVSQAGATPEFVDVDERTCTLDPVKLKDFLENECDLDPKTKRPVSRRTKKTVTAIVPVHLYGQCADMDPIFELAQRYRLAVVEDACQAHGAEYFSKKEKGWKKAGSMGHAAAFSFYPGKNLGACGEGGAATTNDVKVAEKIRMLRDHGQSKKYYHDIEGYNGRLDSIQAGILGIKLKHLGEWNKNRRIVATIYHELLDALGDQIELPEEISWTKSVYHLFVIRTDKRAELQQFLKDAGVGTGIHYPIPLHVQKAYRHLGYQQGDFPVSEKLAAEILSLPMYPQLGHDQQKYVAEKIGEFFSERSAAKVPSRVLATQSD
jgi:dTDP-4-amino-4,6-dideoxygalactose transaminase